MPLNQFDPTGTLHLKQRAAQRLEWFAWGMLIVFVLGGIWL